MWHAKKYSQIDETHDHFFFMSSFQFFTKLCYESLFWALLEHILMGDIRTAEAAASGYLIDPGIHHNDTSEISVCQFLLKRYPKNIV